MAIYKPSGKVLRIDAHSIQAAPSAAEFWSTVPPPLITHVPLRKSIRQQASGQLGIAGVFGKWPGDESEDAILEALEALS